MAGTPIYLKDVVNLWKSVSDWVTGATVDTPKVQDDAVKTEIALMKTELAAIRAAQMDGSAKFTLSGTIASDSGLAANRPDAASVRAGFVYYSVDTDVIEYSDGAKWVVM